jgi:subfamily B ATP-binding cassette protein MsbA
VKTAAPGSDARRADSVATYKRLLGYVGPYRGFALVAVLGMAFEAAAAGAFTWMMQPLVDETFVARNPVTALWLPLAILGLFTVRGLATFATDYGMARIGRGVVATLRQQLLARLLILPSPWFDRESNPAIVQRLTWFPDQVAQATSDALKVIVTDTLTLIALLTVMLMQSVKVTLTMLIMGPVIVAIVAVVGKRYRRINASIQDSMQDLARIGEEAIGGQQLVKLHGAAAQETARFGAVVERNRRLQVKIETTKATSSALVQWIAALALAVIVWLAGVEAMSGRLAAGEFVSLMTAMMAMLPSLKRITNVQSMIQRGVSAADAMFELLDTEPEVDQGTHRVTRAAGRVVFDAVELRYDAGREPALRGVSFVAEPGKVTAIVGRSGSGKTSLVRLLPRFYTPDAGSIVLDGTPIGEIPLTDLRRQIAFVGQDTVLFDDTVANNIAYASTGKVDRAAVIAAAEAANAMEFIRALPQGLDTPVGERGVLLSGGQRQRIAIARAILRDAPILILDEATSALDNESERLIQTALERVMRERTTLVIAHRLSTIEHADQVLVLDRGRVAERGTHAELLAAGGLYAQLHSMQFRES